MTVSRFDVPEPVKAIAQTAIGVGVWDTWDVVAAVTAATTDHSAEGAAIVDWQAFADAATAAAFSNFHSAEGREAHAAVCEAVNAFASWRRWFGA